MEGVVTGDFTGRRRLSGFYLMSASHDRDGNNASSEGLFVHLTNAAAAKAGLITAGRRIRVEGQVKEYHGLTELTAVSRLKACGAARQPLKATPLQWPLENPESLEGMLVETGELSVISQRELARYGSLALAPERLFVPTQLESPAVARLDGTGTAEPATPMLLLDDGSSQTNPDQIYRLSPQAGGGRPLRLGDRVQPFKAILDYRYGKWRLQPLSPIAFRVVNDRPEAPLPAPEALRLAAFNLQNFFNGDGQGGGFPTSRGAATEIEYQRQKKDLVAALSLLKADIIAVSEIENDGYGPRSAIADLAQAMGPGWAFVDFADKGAGTDAITNGLLYQHERVTQVGTPATLDRGSFRRGNRPALAAAFQRVASQDGTSKSPLVVVANHLKSKRCNKALGANADAGDGQGCWAELRKKAVQELVEWLKSGPTGAQARDSVLLGDFNSYRQEAPMNVLRQQGFYNPAELQTYSYVYDGHLGTLDYAWVSPKLRSAVVGAGAWHGNVDELRAEGASAEPLPWGVSDHDPVWVDLDY